MKPDTTPLPGAQPIPTWAYSNEDAQAAFEAYSALCRLSVKDHKLGRNPVMVDLRSIAYRRFLQAFEAL